MCMGGSGLSQVARPVGDTVTAPAPIKDVANDRRKAAARRVAESANAGTLLTDTGSNELGTLLTN